MEAKELLKKVRKIEIKSRGLSRDIFAGHYHSAFKGRGMAFSEVREYQPGDDVRSIDWNVTARFNHPYVKVYEEERELTVMLLIDASGSQEFGTRGMLKKNLMTEIAAVLSFSAIHNNDKIGVIFFSNKVEKFIPPKKGRKHILHIIRELIDFIPVNRGTDLSEPLRYLTNAIKKRSTAFILSDFLVQPDMVESKDAPTATGEGMHVADGDGDHQTGSDAAFDGTHDSGHGGTHDSDRGKTPDSAPGGAPGSSAGKTPGSASGGSRHANANELPGNGKVRPRLEETLRIAARKHDLVAIRIYDERERKLPPVGMLRVMDAETGEVRWIDSLSLTVRRIYSEWWDDHDRRLNEMFIKNGIDAVSVATGEDYVKPLINLFKRR